jgi:hypothetical protein
LPKNFEFYSPTNNFDSNKTLNQIKTTLSDLRVNAKKDRKALKQIFTGV